MLSECHQIAFDCEGFTVDLHQLQDYTAFKKKSQNCVKAAIALVCTTCKRELLFALLKLINFVCTTAIENILSNTPIVYFCMPCCNCKRFYRKKTFVWITATITLHHIITVVDF